MTWLLFLASATVVSACTSAPAQVQSDPPSPTVVLADLVKSPERFVNTSLRVRGKLANVSENYFSRNRRIVLTDGTASIDVKPWLPLSAPPQPTGDDRPTLAAYLDRQVDLVATVRKTQGKDGSPVYVLEVKEATLVKPQ